MSIEGDIHAALMAHAETITGYTMVWPRIATEQPAGEHLRVSHVPNEPTTLDLSGKGLDLMGFLYLTLVSDLLGHEAESMAKAGLIGAHFQIGQRLTSGEATLTITGRAIRPGRQENGRWETPVRISYRAIT